MGYQILRLPLTSNGVSKMWSTVSIYGTLNFLWAIKKRAAQVIQGRFCIQAKWLIRPALVSSFYSMKQLGVFLLPLNDKLVHHRIKFAVPIYPPGWREALLEFSVLSRNTIQCPQARLNLKIIDLEVNILTITPPLYSNW